MRKLSSVLSSTLQGGVRRGLLFVALLATTTLWAYDFRSGDLYYNITSDTTVEVTYQYEWSSDNYAGLTTATIPETVTYNSTTYSVTSIGDLAFDGCSSLTSITIPNSVTSIGSSAFYYCSSLTSVTINSDAIVRKAYSYDSNISHIFGSQVTEYIIGESVTSIGDWAFYDCSSLTSITIPNSVTSIGEDAFQSCTSLTSITIPNSVTSIGDYAFYDCSSLTSITIPNSVTSIGEGAFSWCTSLTSVTIPNSVTSIGDDAFSSCSSLTSITIPNSVTSIGRYAFKDCSSLTSITIPNSVTSIGEAAFYGCSSLTSITIPNSVTSIGEAAFYGCSSLTSITIPNSVTSIGDDAFRDCSRVTMQGTTPPSISASTFSDNATIFVPCSAMDAYLAAPVWQFLDLHGLSHHVNLNATEGGSAQITAANCESNNVTISATPNAGYHFVEWSDGNGNATRDLYLQSDTTLFATFAVGEYGGKCGDDLYWTYSDNTITITGSGDMDLDTYPAWKSYYDDWYANVSAVQFPEGITSIDNYAFSEMSLNSVVVPASVTYFGENAFAYNDNLTRFEYLGTEAECEINSWGRGMLYRSDNLVYFKGQKDMLSYIDSYDLDTVIITSGEGFYEFYWSNIKYIDNFNADDWVVKGGDYAYMNPVHTIILPEGLQEIGDFALTNARHLEQITIPAGVTRIGESAFEECRSLESVTFAGTALREIGDWAFYNCHSLKDITIPEGVTSIGKAAFFDCSYLKEITLPSTVQTIADNAFGQCQKVGMMTVNAMTPPIVEAETFEDVDRSIPLYVPIGTSLQYKAADYWCEFFNVIEYNVPTAIDNIPSSTINCQKIIRDGQLLIIRDGKTYNVMGAEIQ